jgi:hypothetical protein
VQNELSRVTARRVDAQLDGDQQCIDPRFVNLRGQTRSVAGVQTGGARDVDVAERCHCTAVPAVEVQDKAWLARCVETLWHVHCGVGMSRAWKCPRPELEGKGALDVRTVAGAGASRLAQGRRGVSHRWRIARSVHQLGSEGYPESGPRSVLRGTLGDEYYGNRRRLGLFNARPGRGSARSLCLPARLLARCWVPLPVVARRGDSPALSVEGPPGAGPTRRVRRWR